MPIRMAFDWVEAPPSTDLLAQSTMAALTIEVDGCVVTSVLDRRSRSCRNHVVTPLVYVAEWLVANWWRLLHEVENERAPRGDFAETHDLAFVGEGFLLPSLTIVPTPQRMRLRWSRYRPLHSEIEFTEQGEAVVERHDFVGTVQTIVEAARERLAGDGLTAECLERDWAAIQTADSGEREFCRAAALYGQDPFAVSQPLADQIIDFWQRTAPTIREDALATANEECLGSLTDWLTGALQCLRATANPTWANVRRALPASSTREPHRRGYELAQAVRAQLALAEDRYDFATDGPNALPSVELQPPPQWRIQGLVAADSPACAITAGGTAGRFLQARALGDYLGRTEHGPAILSGLATDRQAQSRAFAAEFLAPSASLRRRLRGRHAHPDEVDELAAAFDVSSYVVRHQIQNHGLADCTEW